MVEWRIDGEYAKVNPKFNNFCLYYGKYGVNFKHRVKNTELVSASYASQPSDGTRNVALSINYEIKPSEFAKKATKILGFDTFCRKYAT